jgi:hypothetical protein
LVPYYEPIVQATNPRACEAHNVGGRRDLEADCRFDSAEDASTKRGRVREANGSIGS